MPVYNGDATNNYKTGTSPQWEQSPNGPVLTLGTDTMYGYAGNDTLFGAGADDVLYGGSDEDMLYGDSGKDKLYGEAGDDTLYGGTGSDSLIGDAGNDYLDGYGNGTEFDILTGGTEADTFVLGLGYVGADFGAFYLGNGHATITDFSFQKDIIQIKGDFADGYSLELSNWGGTATLDTGIRFQGDLIGVVQDQNITNLNPNEVFISAPPIFPG